jgi:hypothetical protein
MQVVPYYVHSGLRVDTVEKPCLLGRPFAGYLTHTTLHNKMPVLTGSKKQQNRMYARFTHQTPMQRGQSRLIGSEAGGSAGVSKPLRLEHVLGSCRQSARPDHYTMEFFQRHFTWSLNTQASSVPRQYQDLWT